MGHRYDSEFHLINLVLDEIDSKLSEFDSNSPRDYLDWEFDVDQCISNFPPFSCRLGVIIAQKLVGLTSLW